MPLSRRSFVISAVAAMGGAYASALPLTPASAADADWQKKWKDLIAAAQKEGKLVMTSGPNPDARRLVPAAFKKAFGVDVEYLTGRGAEIANRLKNEQSAGLYTIDVAVQGADNAFRQLYGAKLIQPVKPHLFHPDALDGSKWISGNVWYGDPEKQYLVRVTNFTTGLVAVNSKFVKPESLTSWDDLLKPELKGKIAVEDPTVIGHAAQLGAYLMHRLGPDRFKKLFIEQAGARTANGRQLADWLARGTYPVVVGITPDEIKRLHKDGFPVVDTGYWPEAPGYTSAGFGYAMMLNNAPHPNAAKLFLNWIVTREGNQVWNSANNYVSVRNDIDNSWAPERVPKPGLDYSDNGDWDYVTKIYPAARKAVLAAMGK